MTVSPPSAAADPGGGPLTVVIVDDTAVQRRFARAAIEADSGLTVVGEAGNGRDGVTLVERLRPRLVLMDLHLPLMNAIEAIERIMATHPTPILVYSSFVDGADRDNAAAALAAGAVDVLEKPTDASRLDEYAESLRRRLRVAGRVRVITHPRGRLTATCPSVSTRRLDREPAPSKRRDPAKEPATARPPVSALPQPPRHVRVVAIGASTGGPQALAALLAELPEDLAAAVVVVQHMADGFIEGMAGWLDTLCPLPVTVGATGMRLSPGTVTVAPSGVNLAVNDALRVTTQAPAPSQYHVPGIDATFASVAATCGSQAVGVLLTGMGRDGAAGLRAMREHGALTIVQDEASCAVYGMPAAAMAIDAAELQLPLPDIAATLRQAVLPAARVHR